MFDVCRIHWEMSTDTMDAICQSIHNEKHCQVFGNKQFFVEAYPIKKKSDFHLGLDKLVKYNGAQEQNGRKEEFQIVMRNY